MTIETFADAMRRLQHEARQPQASPTPRAAHSGSRWITGDFGRPDCPHCRGLGYVRVEVPVRHPLFGKLLRCECTEGVITHADRPALDVSIVSHMASGDRELKWSDIVPTPAITPAVNASRKTLQRSWGWVYLHGGNGPGKTLVLKTAVAVSARLKLSAAYVIWPDLLQHLRGGYRDDSFDERMDAWRDVEILAIDEFGRGKQTEWAEEAMLRVLDHRYTRATRENTGVTLYASNYAPDDYHHFDTWMTSRLLDKRFEVVPVQGPDMRLVMEA